MIEISYHGRNPRITRTNRTVVKALKQRKCIIPSSERNKVLENLALMSINKFSLFGNEEGLILGSGNIVHNLSRLN